MVVHGLEVVIFCIGAASVSCLSLHVYYLLLADGGNSVAWDCMPWGRPSCGFEEQSWEFFWRGHDESGNRQFRICTRLPSGNLPLIMDMGMASSVNMRSI